MTADRDTERIVQSWLEVGVTALPDHILDTVLDQLPATPQRRSMWPTRRFAQMTTPFKLAIGAAGVLLVAIVGYNLLPGSSQGVGGPGDRRAEPVAIARLAHVDRHRPQPGGRSVPRRHGVRGLVQRHAPGGLGAGQPQGR